MNYIPSINIEYGVGNDFEYIVTPNAQTITGNIVSGFHSGIHCFTIIGTYGTGKSSYLMALTRDLTSKTKCLLRNKTVFNGNDKYECLNITADYNALQTLLAKRMSCEEDAVMDGLAQFYNKAKAKGKFVVICIDEFGKVLEHAAKVNPEGELYFLQKLAEFINVRTRNIVLLTTLHQNFGTYAFGLKDSQREEWMKVKGRYKELVFNEPVEQVLLLAAERMTKKQSCNDAAVIERLLDTAKESKIISSGFDLETATKLYPLDPISATCLTKAIQRYGQNERTLFDFLSSETNESFRAFKPSPTETFNLARVYDYVTYNFHSALSAANADSTNWTAMRIAIERAESGVMAESEVEDAVKTIKAIGLLNLFCSSSASISKPLLLYYAEKAMAVKDATHTLDLLCSRKIVRYASYKSSYILFDGTDIDIANELHKASALVPVPQATTEELEGYVEQKAVSVAAEYYKTGTPRYFEYIVANEPQALHAKDDIDGFVQLVFPLGEGGVEQTLEASRQNDKANIYAVFTNVADISAHLHEIKKLQYIIDNVILDDRVAMKEALKQMDYEKKQLNDDINLSLRSSDAKVVWIHNGKKLKIDSYCDFNQQLAAVCREIFKTTPIIRNELFNKQKISSAIALARVRLLDAMLADSDKENFGFDSNTCPPEKAIYYTLFKSTGIHAEDGMGGYMLGNPQNDLIVSLWETCDEFIKSTSEKPRKLGELIKTLKAQPLKLKQGVIDFWLPIFIFLRQQDFAIYNRDGAYVMSVNKELFELLKKYPNEYSIKAFNVSGVKMEFFRKYRQFLHKDGEQQLTTSSFIETFKPFLMFYRSLDDYAKTTRKFENPNTARFRDVLANAKDPERTFFEQLPEALGYKNMDNDKEFANDYLDKIKEAVHELRTAYDNLIARIERAFTERLSLPSAFDEYKPLLNERYKNVKKHLLTQKARHFLERILSPSVGSKDFLEKITNVITDKRLAQLRDKEEEHLIDNIVFLFNELDRYVAISDFGDSDDEVFNFELASNVGNISQSKTYRLPNNQKSRADEISDAIQQKLTGDANLDVCILLKLLNEKLSGQ